MKLGEFITLLRDSALYAHHTQVNNVKSLDEIHDLEVELVVGNTRAVLDGGVTHIYRPEYDSPLTIRMSFGEVPRRGRGNAPTFEYAGVTNNTVVVPVEVEQELEEIDELEDFPEIEPEEGFA